MIRILRKVISQRLEMKYLAKNRCSVYIKMFEFVLCALKPDDKMPQIGDTDTGRLYI